MLYALIALCGILSFLSIRNSFFPLKLIAGFSWWAFLFYWLTNPVDAIARGDPTDVAIMGILIMLGTLFLLWGLASRKPTSDVEETYSGTGRLINRIVKSTTKASQPQDTSLIFGNNAEYRNTVRKAARGGKTRRRK